MANTKELTDNLRAFKAYNRGRIEKAFQIVPLKSTLAIQLVPLLLHYNLPGIPGFVECEGECGGIALFELTEDIRVTARRNIGDFRAIELAMKKRRPKAPMIESLLLMGSVGTVMQTDMSDYDYWVVINESELDAKKLDLLKRKLLLIEEWAAKKGAELHFFPTDVNRVRINDFGSSSSESVGSAQRGLLKEEFYRTMLHVSGKYPAWWLTGVNAGVKQYRVTLKALSQSRDPGPDRFIDLGNVSTIPMDEYFGAALWQITKATDYPFKSMLKMALLESFINADGEALLLCEELKKNVLSQNPPPYSHDPYLLMTDRLMSYYKGKKRDDVVDLIRRCFYITIKVKLGNIVAGRTKLTYKEEAMLHFTQEWKWNNVKIAELDKYSDWDFEQVKGLGKELNSFLMEAYKSFTSGHKSSGISQKDFTILGRKILAHNYPKPGKIMSVRRAIDDALRQQSCTFMPKVQYRKKTRWTVYRGNVTSEVARKYPIKYAELRESKSLVELVAWLVVNRMVDSGTFFHLIPNPLPVSLKEIQQLAGQIEEFLPYNPVSEIDNKQLLKEASTVRILVVANLVSDQWAKNLEEMDVIYRNSHGETFCEAHDAKTGRDRLIEIVSKMESRPGQSAHNLYRVFVPRSNLSAKLEKMITNLILNNIG